LFKHRLYNKKLQKKGRFRACRLNHHDTGRSEHRGSAGFTNSDLSRTDAGRQVI